MIRREGSETATDRHPKVSVIIPCRNEEKFIGACIESVLANNYPPNRLEILVVDGRSEDATRAMVRSHNQRERLRLLDNPRRNVTAAINIGIRHATGELIMILGGAHATYAPNYILTSVQYLRRYDVDNVGGVLVTTPADATPIARAIAFALSHPFGAGNSYFRIGSRKLRWVDTVFGGCYRRELFERLGLWNEALPRGSDMDFHMRLRKAGGKILLVPEIVAYYYPKSTFRAFAQHNYDDAFWTFYLLKAGSRIFRLRHMTPLVFLFGVTGLAMLAPVWPACQLPLIAICVTYLLSNLIASIHVALRKQSWICLVTLPVAFAVRHFAYGLGGLVGLCSALKQASVLTKYR